MRHSSKACAELRRNPDNAPLAKELILAYERVGTPLPAIEFLQQQPRLPANLELLADIATVPGKWTWRYRHGSSFWPTLLRPHPSAPCAQPPGGGAWQAGTGHGLAGGRAPCHSPVQRSPPTSCA